MGLLQMFIKRFPGWIEPPLSVLHYAADAGGRRTNRSRFLWAVIAAGFAGVALAGSSSPILSQLPEVGLMLIHWTALALALLWTSDVVATEQRQGTWEMLRITSYGSQLLIRAKWTAIFYRMRPLIVILVGARLVAIGLVLADLTAYQGHHLELYAPAPLAISAVELAALFAAVLLQVPILFGFNAALGLLIASSFQRVSAARLLCLGLLVVQSGLSVPRDSNLAVIPGNGPTPAVPAAAPDISSVLRDGIAGSYDLNQLSSQRILWAWADAESSALHGGVLLAFVVVQAFVAQMVLGCATRLVSNPLLA